MLKTETFKQLQLGKTSLFFFYLNFVYIGVQLIYTVVLVSGIQQSYPITHVYFLFQILLRCRLLQDIE